ncbi:hypothetical protein PPERSA_03502 [Pseudocohnilembus persalinus]|uniref:Palmitoyltransferase n=1 Tax=Pseudocohnilembus persalinus TaxID=266149 RepID=A0A0V0QBV1_PSEPJ|nr:hypothetical protein PPERSA_03502 [Pseudocohnilembus persalinus]|eukprot:KRW99701.1 hypothetical protein PPERSA_03502 [Pseudocohnilembus persalinus]
MNIDDSEQLDIESDYRSSQGVDIEQEKQKLKKQKNNKHGHNHQHGKCKDGHSKIKKGFQNRNWTVLFFTMFMPVQGYILQYFWFFDLLLEKDGSKGFSYYGNLGFMLFIAIMNIQTYYVCVFTKNTPYKKSPPVVDTTLEETYQNDKTCQNCDQWKPIRTSHCSACGECIMRMDHHCPWVDNCVGLKNHQAFLLFTAYMAAGAIQYLYHSIQYCIYQNDKPSFFDDHNILFFLYWTMVGIIIGPITLMLLGLTIFHGTSLLNNTTTLQSMGGYQVRSPLEVDQTPRKEELPQGDYQGGTAKSINVYDMGVLANIASFFMSDRAFFWLAKPNEPENDGVYVTQNPPVYKQEHVRFQMKDQYPKDADAPINEQYIIQGFQEEINREKKKFANKQLKFGLQTFKFSLEESDQIPQKNLRLLQRKNKKI